MSYPGQASHEVPGQGSHVQRLVQMNLLFPYGLLLYYRPIPGQALVSRRLVHQYWMPEFLETSLGAPVGIILQDFLTIKRDYKTPEGFDFITNPRLQADMVPRHVLDYIFTWCSSVYKAFTVIKRREDPDTETIMNGETGRYRTSSYQCLRHQSLQSWITTL